MKVPDMIKSNNPAEIIEFHVAALKDTGAIPASFRLSDARRKYIQIIVTLLNKVDIPPEFQEATHITISMLITDAVKAQRYETG